MSLPPTMRPSAFHSILLNGLTLSGSSGAVYFNGYPLMDTTGNQTIAGTKTFNSSIYAPALVATNGSEADILNSHLVNTGSAITLDWQNRLLTGGNWQTTGTPTNPPDIVNKNYCDAGDLLQSGRITVLSGIVAAGVSTTGLQTGYVVFKSAPHSFHTGNLSGTIATIPTGYMFLLDSCEIICTKSTVSGSPSLMSPTVPALVSFGYTPPNSFASGDFASGIEFGPTFLGYRVINSIEQNGVPVYNQTANPVTIGFYVNSGIQGINSGDMSGICMVKGILFKY